MRLAKTPIILQADQRFRCFGSLATHDAICKDSDQTANVQADLCLCFACGICSIVGNANLHTVSVVSLDLHQRDRETFCYLNGLSRKTSDRLD